MDLKILRLNVIIVVGFVILFACISFIFFAPIFNPDRPGMSIIKINESGVPDGPVVHMVEDDFNEYPYLAPIIRDNSQQGIPYKNGTRIDYTVGLSWKEYEKILGSKFFKNPEVYFFQYHGNYYSFGSPVSLPNLTITKIHENGVIDGKIIQISDEDFDEFPCLAPIIRDNSPDGIPNMNGTGIDYVIEIPVTDHYKILTSKFYPHPDIFIEYRGNNYLFTLPWIP